MSTLKYFFCATLILLLASTGRVRAAESEKITPEYREALIEFLHAYGFRKEFGERTEPMISLMQWLVKDYNEDNPDDPFVYTEREWTALHNEFQDIATEYVAENIAPAFVRHMNLDDLRRFTEYLNAPLSREFLSKMGLVGQEKEFDIMGRVQYGDSVDGILERMKKEYPKLMEIVSPR